MFHNTQKPVEWISFKIENVLESSSTTTRSVATSVKCELTLGYLGDPEVRVWLSIQKSSIFCSPSLEVCAMYYESFTQSRL